MGHNLTNSRRLSGVDDAEERHIISETVRILRSGTGFARMTDHETFNRLAMGELHRRGTESAGVVVAVMDGSEGLQKFIDMQRSDAVRILDFPHAREHVAAAAHAAFGPRSATAAAWLNQQATTLCHGDPSLVLGALRELSVSDAVDTAGIWAYRPSIQKGVQALGKGMSESGLISEKLRCLINVRIASQVGCGF